ncbi:MAG: hypothetical protein GF364_21920, partial [Candidatus Lokiarchaeota archaeon]|nr:hypothetical protein [Candidatus Lokiarchaeota archaeon]
SNNKDDEIQYRYLDADLEEVDEDEEYFIDKAEKKTRKSKKPPESSQPSDKPPKPRRFQYKRPVSRKRKIQLLGIFAFIIIAVLVVFLYVIPVWHANISLQSQLYSVKAGNLSFWDFYILNGWSTSFIFNWIGLMGAIIGCTIMSLPPEKNLIALIGTRLGFGRPSNKKSLLIWWSIGFVIFYFAGLLIDGFNNNFSITMYYIQNGFLDVNLGDIFLPFQFLVNIDSITAETHMARIFVYSNVLLPIIMFILAIILIRLILNMIGVAYLKRNDYKIASNACFIIMIFFLMNFYSVPNKALDHLSFIHIWINPIGIFGFMAFGIVFRVLAQKTERYMFENEELKRFGIASLILIFCILIPLFVSIPTAININNNYSSWLEDRWEAKINKQREWTVHAAGLDMFEEREIQNLTDSEPSNLVKAIRQYDKDAAIYQMNTIGQSPFETLADSDIVYVRGNEYWVAPKTLKVQHFEGDPIKSNTNMFDHVEGFLALYTYNGSLILNSSDFVNTFGVNISHPIFFGEYSSSSLEQNDYFSITGDDYEYDFFSDISSYGAFDDDILLNTGWQDDETNYAHTYEGTPDGSLTGLEAFWYTTNLGLFSYAINRSFEKNYVINRNIRTRVENILLPGLWVDEDPYLVFDYENGKMYYALSICTNLNLKSYSTSPILRFLGVALIDTEFGTMEFVKNPMLEGIDADDDPTYPMWQLYMDKYPWIELGVEGPEYDWLREQLRYPEQLFEIQLSYQYKYHVDDPDVWQSGAQFHERPEEGDLFYIEFDLGLGQEFVGIDLVERKGVDAITLAGMYVLRHAEHFGEVIFYEAPSKGSFKIIGPSTARTSFQASASQELYTIENRDIGNTLLYPLAGSLYYVIPVYSTTTEGGSTIQFLQKLGLVNAFDTQKVVFGDDANEAYLLLNYTETETFEEGNITISYEIRDSPTLDAKIIDLETLYSDDNLSAPQKHVTVNISLRTDIVDITKFGSPVPNSEFTWGSGKTGMNFTVIDMDLYPREGYSVGLNLTADIGSLYSVTVEFKIVLIVDSEVIEFPEDEWDKVTILG